MKRFSGLELKSISLNTLFQLIVRLIASGTGLVVTLIIAHFLGYETVGSFTKVTEFVAVFYLIVDFGFNSIFLKQHFKKIENQMGNLVVTRLFIALLLIPVIALIAFLLPQNASNNSGFSNFEKTAIFAYSLTLVAVALNTSILAFLQQKLANKLTIIPGLLSSVVLLLIIYRAANTSNYYLLFVAYIFSGFTYAFFAYLFIKKNYPLSLILNNSRAFAKKLILSSWPLGLVLFINFLYVRVDVFLLALYKPNLEVGIYGISYRFFDVAVAIPTFLATSTYPLLLKNMGNPKTYNLIFKRYLTIYAGLSIAATILIILFAPLIQIFKKEFLLSVLPLQILTVSLPFFFLTSLLQWHFVIKNKMKFLVPLYAGGLLLNVILNIFFIPYYSYFAASVITGLSEALVFVAMLWYFVKTK